MKFSEKFPQTVPEGLAKKSQKSKLKIVHIFFKHCAVGQNFPFWRGLLESWQKSNFTVFFMKIPADEAGSLGDRPWQYQVAVSSFRGATEFQKTENIQEATLFF